MGKWQPNPSNVDNVTLPPKPEEGGNFAEWAEYARRSLDHILMLRGSAFWSTLIIRKEILEWFDEIVQWLPRPYDEDNRRVLARDEGLLSATRLLRGSALCLVLRMAVYDKNEKAGGPPSSKEWFEVAFCPVLPTSRLAFYIGAFAPPHEQRNGRNRKNLTKVLAAASEAGGAAMSERMIELEQEQIAELTRLDSDVRRLQNAWDTKSKAGNNRATMARFSEQFLQGAVDWMYSALAFYLVATEAGLRFRPAKLVPVIAAVVESLLSFLTLDALVDIAVSCDGYPIDRLLRFHSQLELFGAELVVALMESMTGKHDDPAKRREILGAILCQKRFACILNERKALTELLPVFAKSNEVKELEDKLRPLIDRDAQETLADLERTGFLKNLGNLSTAPDHVTKKVDEITKVIDVMKLSVPYVHACLRHKNYDMNATVDMIASGMAPRWLNRVEGVENWWIGKGAKGAPLPPLFGCDIDLSGLQPTTSNANENENEEEDERRKQEEQQLLAGQFLSLSLGGPRKEDTPVKKIESGPGSTAVASAAILERVEAELLRLPPIDPMEEGEASRLVPMAHSKIHARAEHFAEKPSERAELRPFYAKFKYEVDERDIEDVYDDEYDDGYEAKEFNAEPVETKDVASSDEEKQREEQRRGTEQRGGGGGRRGEGGQRGGRDSTQQTTAPPTGGAPSRGSYTGGRDRQYHEKNKNKFRQRGADRKARGGMGGAPA